LSETSSTTRRNPGSPRDLGRRAVNAFVERAAERVPAGSLVLDLGAGEGWYRGHFPDRRYYAVDLALGDRRWDYGGLDILADLHRLPFREGVADAVLTTQTLEHLVDPGEYLLEIARVLRPGGTLHLTAPQSFREHQAPHDYWRFTQYSLRMLAEKAGLEAIEVEALGGYFAFMGDRFPAFHRYMFSNKRKLRWRILTAPISLLSRPFFTRFLPWMCAKLDPLDTKRTWVNGYGLHARKPGGAS
jgi:SAM-dependent methyltransferase